MAIAHISVKIHSRSKGRSSVALAAYRSGSRFIDTRLGIVHNYARKSVDYSVILAPSQAPQWVFDRERLWNAVESREKFRDAQVAREIELALPVELNRSQQRDLVRDFINAECVERGMVADINIHLDNPNNPHAHVLLTMRHLTQKGFGTKNRDWNQRPVLRRWRSEWEITCNRALQRAGHDVRIDCRSHEDRGLAILPTKKIGLPKAGKLLERAAKRLRWVAARLSAHERVLARNAEAIIRDPKVALALITFHEATFTQKDVATWLHSRVSKCAFDQCQAAVMQSDQVIRLRSPDDTERFTSVDMLASEQKMLALCDELDRRGARGLQSASAITAVSRGDGLSAEQEAAVMYLVRETGDLAILEGWAGAGKSRLLGVARQSWVASGRRVIGCALSGQAARVLAESAGLNEGRSIASLKWAWDRGRDCLRAGDVLVVDEAGLVGTHQMEMLLREASRANAKVVLVGDGEQLQAIEAGGAFRAMARLVGKVEVRGIRRQEKEWMRTASCYFARGDTKSGLGMYFRQNCIRRHVDSTAAFAAIVTDYLDYEKKGEGTQCILAYKRADVDDLNRLLQAERRALGRLVGHIKVQTDDGLLDLGCGDRIMLTKNHRGMGIQNGLLATVTGGGTGSLRLRLDDGRSLSVELHRYNHFALGYAMTVHKSQGLTVDCAHVLACRAYDRHAAYVAMTRHTKEAVMHYDGSSIQDLGMLEWLLSRERRKNLALDFDRAEGQALAVRADAAKAKEQATTESAALASEVARANARLREIGDVLKVALPRIKSLVHDLPELLPLRHALTSAAERRDFFRSAVEGHGKAWVQRLGWGRKTVRDPTTQETVDASVELKLSEAAVDKAAAALEAAVRSPPLLKIAQSKLAALKAERASLEAERLVVLKSRDIAHAKLHETLKRQAELGHVIELETEQSIET